ncbi:MAG: autotransporter domain-containing protein [Nitrospinales bacterium]
MPTAIKFFRYTALAIGMFLIVCMGIFSTSYEVEANATNCPAFGTKYPGSALTTTTNCTVPTNANARCPVCHEDTNPGSSPQTNLFGVALKNASGDIATRLGTVETIDSDGDGWHNKQEIDRGTLPGNIQAGTAVGALSLQPPAPSIANQNVDFDLNDPSVAFSIPLAGSTDLVGLVIDSQPAGGENVSCSVDAPNNEIDCTWDASGFGASAATTSFQIRAYNPNTQPPEPPAFKNSSGALITLRLRTLAMDDAYNLNQANPPVKVTLNNPFTVLNNDINLAGTITSVAVAVDSTGTNGVLAVNANGVDFDFTPSVSFVTGQTTFTYTFTNDGGKTSNAATVTINMAATLPIASNDDENNSTPPAVDENSSVDIDVLDNDTTGQTATGIDITTTTPCKDTTPQHGTIQVMSGSPDKIRYTNTPEADWPPAGDASGTDTFTYCATNANGRSILPATVSVVVSSLPVVATDDSFNVDVGSSTTDGVTTNDTTAGTADEIVILTLPTNGTLNINGADVTGADIPLTVDPIVDITYTPDPGFLGPTDTYTYSAHNGADDPIDGSNEGTVTVNISFSAVLGNSAILNGTKDPALFPVAKALDDVCVDLANIGIAGLTDDQADLLSNCVVLSTEATNGVPIDTALNSINNKSAFAASTIGIRLAQTSMNNVNERLAQVRGGGGGGFNANGLKIGYKNIQVPFVQVASLIQNTTELYFPKDEYEPLPWGIFINGGFSLGDQDATANEPGFDFDSRGVTFGGDYRFTENFLVGAAFTFSNTMADQINNAGEIGINGRSATLYGIVSPVKNMFFEWQAGYGTQFYESKRNISFAAGGFLVDRQAIASYDGYQVSALGAFVYDLHKGNLTFSPNIELSYIHGTVDPYSESRAGGLNLMVSEQTYESLFSSVGGRVSYSFETSFGLIIPRVMFEVNHEFLEDVRTISQNFVSAPTGSSAFTIRSDKPVDRDFFTIGAGVEAHFGEQVTGFIDYSTLQGLENTSNHSFSAGLRVRF